MNKKIKIIFSIIIFLLVTEIGYTVDFSHSLISHKKITKMSKTTVKVLPEEETTLENSAPEPIQDDLVNSTLDKSTLKHPITNTKYNYDNIDRVPVKLKVTKVITTKKDIEDGEIVDLRIRQDVKYKKKLVFRQNTPATARIKTYMTPGMNGIPGQIVMSDFNIPNIDSRKLSNLYVKRGMDRSLWVYPLKWMLTILPPSGSLTNFILGGNAKITENDTILLYYYPNRTFK